MNSVISQKIKLHQTLLSFPPFFTYHADHTVSKNTNNPARNKQAIGHKQSIHFVEKKLAKDQIVIILRNLQKLGCVEFQAGQKILISHFSPYQMADDMYKWAKDNFLIGDVETLDFIAEGDRTTPQNKFYKQPKEILLKVIDILEKSNKAAKIEIDYDVSVKFL